MTETFAPIEQLVTAWTDAWSRRDVDGVLALWDQDDADASYLPAEGAAPLIGADNVRAYASNLCGAFDVVRHRPLEILTRRLSASAGLAFYTVAWMIRDSRGPIGGTCRVTSVWRNRGDGWRCCHYAEAPLAPLLELQHHYEAVAADGLDAIPHRATRP